MAWALGLLTLLTYCAGVSSRAPWTQPASVSVAPGQTSKLSCTVNNDGNTISWLQQRVGQAPRYVHCTGCSSRGEGFPNRFTATKSGNVGYLTITDVRAEDEANYFCLMWSSTDSMWIFGGGTRLQVTGQPTSPPTVNLFSPPAKDMQNEQKAMLVCLMDNFNPGEVTVTWEADGATISTGVETTVPVKHNTNYMASSYLTLDTSKWQSHERFTCKVTHKGTEYPKTINRSECP